MTVPGHGVTVRIYSGDPDTGTVVVFGLALRHVGAGKRVALVCFRRGRASGEVEPAARLGMRFFNYGADESALEEAEFVGAGWRTALELVKGGEFDLLILDGLLDAISNELIDMDAVVRLLEQSATPELVLTGRSSPVELVKRADTVIEMLDIKH